jgi:hypothetical protein
MQRTVQRFLPALALLHLAVLAPMPIKSQEAGPLTSEFHFARLAFGAYGGAYGGGRGEPWLRDWPEADYHFLQGLTRLTLMDATTFA